MFVLIKAFEAQSDKLNKGIAFSYAVSEDADEFLFYFARQCR